MSQQAIADAIGLLLTADQSPESLWSDLSGRIYHLQAPANSPLPRLVYRILADKPQAFAEGPANIKAELEFDLAGR